MMKRKYKKLIQNKMLLKRKKLKLLINKLLKNKGNLESFDKFILEFTNKK